QMVEDVKISDLSDDVSADLRAEEGDNTISSLMFKLTQDTRNNVFNPTSGYLLWGSVEGTGGAFGGDKDFAKLMNALSVYSTYYDKKLVLELKGLSGFADAFGDSRNVPVYERFYTGGANSIRGYRERRIGPKDPGSNIPVGGEALLVGNAELTFPIYEKVLKGAIFYDIGNAWTRWNDIGTGGFKSGTGLGIRVKTPIGPVKLDWGYPLSEVTGENKKGRLHFSISQGF
ncbi:MAG: BamA/TamA family outer membrane protein, partial [Candidatus Omnitrophota bacterium]